jgi:hypothetical protein
MTDEQLIRAQVFQEIREAAGREDVVEAAWEAFPLVAPTESEMVASITAMLDQIERTQKP